MILRFLCLLFLASTLSAADPTSGAAAPSQDTSQVQILNQAPPAPLPRSTTSQVDAPKEKAKPTGPVSDEIFTQSRPSLVLQAVAISMMALFPFAVMLLSPFLKFVVVLSLLRTALGVQNSPPNMIINGVALMMALFILYPTATKIYDAIQPVLISSHAPESLLSSESPAYIIKLAQVAGGPMKQYLKDNSLVKHQRIFFRMIYRNLPENLKTSLQPDDLIVIIPAYITGQLKEAFEIGVLIYIPFFVIDMVVSNILLAMGMMMLSPVTISMPLKLFLLVMLDGWTILIEGLVQTFK